MRTFALIGSAALAWFLLADGSASASGLYTYSYFDVPGALLSSIAINNYGDVVGTGATGSFLRSPDGSLTFFSISNDYGSYTSAWGINDLGQIVGHYADDSAGVYQGFLLNPGGTYQTLNIPGALGGTFPTSINNVGQIVGGINPSGPGDEQKFVLDASGSATFVPVPGGTPLGSYKINNLGQVMGGYALQSVDGGFSGQVGFLRNPDGTSTVIQVPGAFDTELEAFNDLDQVLLVAGDGPSSFETYLWDPDGTYEKLDITPPGSGSLEIVAINNSGQLAGLYQDASNKSHVFVATPTAVPEPCMRVVVGLLLAVPFGIYLHRLRTA